MAMKRKIDGNVEITGTLNDHTIPAGTGTLALTSDISAAGIALDVTNSGDQLIIESNDTGYPELLLRQPEFVTVNTNGPKITLEKISYDSINPTRNGDELGRIDFKGHRNGNVDQVYGSIIGISAVDNNPGPAGWIEFEVSDQNENSISKMVTIFGGTAANAFHQGLRIDRGHLWLAPYSGYTGAIILEGSTHDLTIRPTGTETSGANLLIPREGGTVITTNSIDDYTSDLTSPVTIQLDDDAASGATLNLYHNSATPADEDILGRINFNGRNSITINETFAYIQAQAFDVTNANEDGYIKIGGQKDGSFKVWTNTGSFTNGSGLEIVTGNLYLNDITDGNIIFEGSTDNGFETTLTVDDPTADRTITLPNNSGTVALTSDIVGGSGITIQDEGSALPTDATIIDFVGAGVTASGTGTTKTITIAGGGGGISNVVEDTTPQLGGNLDVNGNTIVSTNDGAIRILPDGDGDVFFETTMTNTTANAGMIGFKKNLPSNISYQNLGSHNLYAYSNSTFAGASASIALHPGTDTSPATNTYSWVRSTRTGNGMCYMDIAVQYGGGNYYTTRFRGSDSTGNKDGLVEFPRAIQPKWYIETTDLLTGATGTVDHDLTQGSVFHHGSISGDFTVNIINGDLVVQGTTTTIALVLSQGSTAYMPTALQIDGSAKTILWQGGTAPSGTANGTDVVSFTVIITAVTGSPAVVTSTVLGSSTSFG